MTLQQNCRQGKVLGGGKRAAVRGDVGSGGSAMGQSAELIVTPRFSRRVEVGANAAVNLSAAVLEFEL